MQTLITIFHIIFCVFLIIVILLQAGKGAGMGAAFGGSSQTVFGPRGSGNFLSRATGIIAALFMLSSFTLAYMSTTKSSGLADQVNALADQRANNVQTVDVGQKPEAPVPAAPTGDAGVAPAAPAGDAGVPQAPAAPAAPAAPTAPTTN